MYIFELSLFEGRTARILSRVEFLVLKIHQRGSQWKQGVVIYMMIYTSSLYNTAPIHGTPLPLHPPVMNTQVRRILLTRCSHHKTCVPRQPAPD